MERTDDRRPVTENRGPETEERREQVTGDGSWKLEVGSVMWEDLSCSVHLVTPSSPGEYFIGRLVTEVGRMERIGDR